VRPDPDGRVRGRIEEVHPVVGSVLGFIRSTTRRSTGSSVDMCAVPSMTTGSEASSVVTQQRESAIRLRTFREPVLLVNHSVLSSHMPQTGMMCGRPSGQTVATQ
jgi:hypothetical protein